MSLGKFRLAISILALAASARTAPAQNLLTNPDFDAPAGLDSWTIHTGSSVLAADSGSCTTSSVVDGLSGISGGQQYFWMSSQQCILVDPVENPEMFVAGMYRTTGNVFARIYLVRFSDTDCGTAIGFSGMIAGATSPEWNRIAGALEIASDTVAVRLMADNNVAVLGAPQFTVQWDRFYLGLPPEIFVDDFEFESGSACHWSSIAE
jgi:hypothetical protein